MSEEACQRQGNGGDDGGCDVMTTRRTVAAGVAVVVLLVGSPARAGYKLMPKGTVQRVGKLGLLVIPPNDWNRLGAKIRSQCGRLDLRWPVAQ